ncbi:hypothetical protein E4Z66_03950 [Aliishimia ponticola]|uniref:PAS fold-3 domain-containing protein n=1 Tax=Aliishimia ponticola TaxID=2499833 RepID=A0A4S4NR89_9RHOB|nr:hypothetical protein [Aliishimia ponticola]THH38730.1 hypothetical protein E4Z66_03950 [Aliishimia ponticola]
MQSDKSNMRFKLEDLFFSRTDNRGIIQAGNQVFQHVSHFPWDKLIGAPHKIVRHPDMPRGVFSLMWRMIQNGEPFGGYVLNRAEDGMPYWVYAVVLPQEDGYISLRLKPSSGHLDKVIPIYEQIRRQENDNDLKPEAARDQIVEAVQQLGFRSYQEFMTRALCDEVASRETKLGLTRFELRETLTRMLRDVGELETLAIKVDKTFAKTHQIPYNMRLQAGRLEGSDGPISVISGNHRMMTQTLEEHLVKFSRESAVGAEEVRDSLFLTMVVHLVREVTAALNKEPRLKPDTRDRENKVLTELVEAYETRAVSEVRGMAERVRRFGDQCRDMRRMMSGLELTRIMCKIERSKFSGEHSGLDEIVNRLASAQENLSAEFDQILSTVAEILQCSEEVERAAQYGNWANVA